MIERREELIENHLRAMGRNSTYYNHSCYGDDPSYLRTYPLPYIVSSPSSNLLWKPIRYTKGGTKKEISEWESYCSVQLNEITCDFMYSNPNGKFNLSVPEFRLEGKNGNEGMNYDQWFEKMRDKALNEKKDYNAIPNQLRKKDWSSNAAKASAVLKVFIERKTRKKLRVSIKFTVQENDKKNIKFPLTW